MAPRRKATSRPAPTSPWTSRPWRARRRSRSGRFGPAWLTYDPAHNVIVEASIFEANFATDNNAMSEITVPNPTTGAVLARLPIANLINSTEASTSPAPTVSTSTGHQDRLARRRVRQRHRAVHLLNPPVANGIIGGCV